jgi:hypothetical protein
MTFRVRIDPVALRQINKFVEYLRDCVVPSCDIAPLAGRDIIAYSP